MNKPHRTTTHSLQMIVLTEEVTPSAPQRGDYTWVWSLATFGLLALLLRRRK